MVRYLDHDESRRMHRLTKFIPCLCVVPMLSVCLSSSGVAWRHVQQGRDALEDEEENREPSHSAARLPTRVQKGRGERCLPLPILSYNYSSNNCTSEVLLLFSSNVGIS